MATTYNSAMHEEIAFEPYSILPSGMYRCRLETISNLETTYGTALKFHWRVVGGDADGEAVSGLANKKLLPKSKLATWARAHLNVPAFPDSFVLKLSSLIGREVSITLGVEPRSDGGGERNVIRAVDPIRATPSKAGRRATSDADEDFTEILSKQEAIPDPGEPIPRSQPRGHQ